VLNGDGAHHAAVRQLRGIKAPKEGVGKLLLAFRASESDRPEAVIIGIKLFVHLLHPHAGAAVSESDAERTKTYSFQVTGSAPGDHSFVYIVAEDSEHNQSVPNPAAISK